MMGGGPTPSPLDGARRWYHRRERSLIVLWLALLLVLNLLPVAWLLANRAWGIEDKLVRGYRWYWHQRYRSAEEAVKKDPAIGLRRMEGLVAELGPTQLRETTGRLRQDALLEIARLELMAGHPKRARRAALEVTGTDPYDWRGWVALGDAQWARKKKGDAVTAYGRALEMNPNIEHAMHRVMQYRADHADWKGVVTAFETYRNAVWSLPARLGFTASWPRFDVSQSIIIPVLADGERHTWRLHPAHPRAVGSFAFRKMAAIDGLSLIPAGPGVVVALHSLRFMPAAGAFDPPPRPILEIADFTSWRAGPGLVSLGGNRWLVRRGDATLRAPIPIPMPSQVARIELDITLSKVVDPAAAGLLRWACHNLGRDDEIKRLLRPVVIVPDPARPGALASAAAAPKAEPHRQLPVAKSETSPAERPAEDRYSIAVAGHLRRGPKDDPPLSPALIAALPEISLSDRALVLTGDVVWEGTPGRWDRFDELLRRPLGIPLFIAPGNHDLFDGKAGAGRRNFVERFGPTWRIEQIGSTLLIVLDTEDPPGDIGPAQTKAVLQNLARLSERPGIRTVVVLLHRVLWFLGEPRYAEVAARANRSSQPGAPGNGDGHRFCELVMPELEQVARTKPVAVIAGDVGTRIPLVYDRRGGLVLIASGNRAQDPPAWWNHYLRLHLGEDRIGIEAVPLGSASLGPVERYTLEFWKTHPGALQPPGKTAP